MFLEVPLLLVLIQLPGVSLRYWSGWQAFFIKLQK